MHYKKVILLVLFSAFICSCSDDKGNNPDVNLDKKALLENYADNLIIPSFDSLFNAVSALKSSFDDLADGYSANKLSKLQFAFYDFQISWENCSPYGFGPAEDVLLRQSLNTFPTDTNRINENIRTGEYSLMTTSNFKAKGLPALDYLLFGYDLSAEESIFSDTKRLDYIKDLINDIYINVESVKNGWKTYRDSFISKTGNDVGSSLSLLVNQYIYDYEIAKRAKIGYPLGIYSSDVLPYNFEAPYSLRSMTLLEENLFTFRNIFIGPDNSNSTTTDNIYKYLKQITASRNDSLLADMIVEKFDELDSLTNKIDMPLSRAVLDESEKSKINDLYIKMQELVVLLKVDMTSAMGIQIIYQDNDGD